MLGVFNVGAISQLPWHSLDAVLAAALGWKSLHLIWWDGERIQDSGKWNVLLPYKRQYWFIKSDMLVVAAIMMQLPSIVFTWVWLNRIQHLHFIISSAWFDQVKEQQWFLPKRMTWREKKRKTWKCIGLPRHQSLAGSAIHMYLSCFHECDGYVDLEDGCTWKEYNK